MKKLIISAFLTGLFISGYPQTGRSDVLQDLEKPQHSYQNNGITAEIKSSTRLFKDKDDLTSVMVVIPADSVVSLIGSDDTFLHVAYHGMEGYIYSRHAEVKSPVAVTSPDPKPMRQEMSEDQQVSSQRPVQQRQKISRYQFLEGKYGSSLAKRLYSGKIWKGMTPEMVKDSWGSPKKINRVINGNNVREEWIYNSTWLYIQNDVLVKWGPTK